MTTTTPGTSQTARLLALITKGDNAFKARDLAAVDAVHRPDMVAYITGRAEAVYGRKAHAAAMQQIPQVFRGIHVNAPYPIQSGGGNWITVVTTVTGTSTGQMTPPDGTVIPRQARRSTSSSARPPSGTATSSSSSPRSGTPPCNAGRAASPSSDGPRPARGGPEAASRPAGPHQASGDRSGASSLARPDEGHAARRR